MMQGGDSNLLESCSPAVRAGLEHLERCLSEKESYTISDGLAFYLLNKVNSELVSDFIKETQTEEYWDGDVGEYHLEVYHICLVYSERGLEYEENEHLMDGFKRATDISSRNGKLVIGILPHGSALRPLSLILPESERTESALSYFENNFDELYLPDMALGILALSEYYPSRYRATIQTGLEMLEEKFNNEIGDTEMRPNSVGYISIVLLVLVRLSNRFEGERAVSWLEQRQHEDGGWGGKGNSSIPTTALVLLVLFAVGEGPKVPRNPIEWENRRIRLQENSLSLISNTEDPDIEKSDKYIESFRRISTGVLTGVIAVESIVILYLILTYNPAIFYSLPTLLIGMITVVASVFTIVLGWEDISEMVRERV